MKHMVDVTHDSIHHIPRNFPKVAGYVTGSNDICWTKDDWKLFGGTLVRIDQSNDLLEALKSDVKDCEPGAARIPTVVAWTKIRQQHGWHSTIYCAEFLSGYSLAEIRAAIKAAGLDASKVWYWIANWNGDEKKSISRLGGDIVAVQFADPVNYPNILIPGTSITLKSANADLSVTTDSWMEVTAPQHHGAHGVFNFAGRFDAGNGQWHIHGTPGAQVGWSDEKNWVSAEIQLCVGGPHKGQWRAKGMKLNAPPLGD